MKIYKSGRDWSGWSWWFRIGKSGIVVRLFDNLHLKVGIDFVYRKDGKWFNVTVFNLDVTFYFNPNLGLTELESDEYYQKKTKTTKKLARS